MTETNPITAVRRSIRDTLAAAGMNAFEIDPDKATPPLAIVDSDDPSLDFEGVAVGEVNLHHRAILVAAPGTTLVTAEKLDEMTVTALTALDSSNHASADVGRYGTTVVNGQNYPAIEIFISTFVRL